MCVYTFKVGAEVSHTIPYILKIQQNAPVQVHTITAGFSYKSGCDFSTEEAHL
jgi:hypothetical protein